MYVNSDNAPQLQLEIWREIMRARGEHHYNSGGMMVGSGGGGSTYTPPPDPVASAKTAVEVFAALYPLSAPKAASKRRAKK